MLAVASSAPQFLEAAVHDYHQGGRVCKVGQAGKVEAGGTEFFLVDQARLFENFKKIQDLMSWFHNAD